MLEFYMDWLIWQLAKVEQKAGACLTSQLPGVGARMRVIIALLHLREIPEKIIKEFRTFEGYIQNLGQQRNRAVHDTWAMAAEGVIQLRLAIVEKKLKFGATPVAINEILKTHDDILKAGDDFRSMCADILEILPPSPGIRPHIPPSRLRGAKAPPTRPNET
jgi:hypothetical protein